MNELGWVEARDPCSSPRCTTKGDLKPFIIPPKPCGHPGLLLQLQIASDALNIQATQKQLAP